MNNQSESIYTRSKLNWNMVTVKNEESFRQVIFVNIALLKFCGIVPPDDKTFSKMALHYFSTILAGGFFTVNSFIFAFEFVKNAANIETAMDLLALTIAFAGGTIRLLILYWSRKTVQKVLEAVEDIWKILNLQERHHVTSYTDSVKNLTHFFLLQCLFTMISYSLVALFSHSVDANMNATRVLPYPFVTEFQSPYYEIAFVIQLSCIANSCITVVAVEMCGPLLINIVCGHFKVIQEQLKSINFVEKTDKSLSKVRRGDNEILDTSGRETRSSHHEESLRSKLRSCVNYQMTILSICTDIEGITNYIFLTQLIGSTYILSVIGFKLTGNGENKYKHTSHIIIGFFQLLICNWPPDSLSTESLAVANAAYSTHWYNWPNDLKKSIHFVMQRAQKPVHLTAGKFVDLSLETFAAMLSTAVSFFTVLRSFN